MEQGIKSCPFCGKIAFIREWDEDDSFHKYYTIGCEDHKLDYCADSEEEAICVWNERPNFINSKSHKSFDRLNNKIETMDSMELKKLYLNKLKPLYKRGERSLDLYIILKIIFRLLLRD